MLIYPGQQLTDLVWFGFTVLILKVHSTRAASGMSKNPVGTTLPVELPTKFLGEFEQITESEVLGALRAFSRSFSRSTMQSGTVYGTIVPMFGVIKSTSTNW